MTELPEAVVLFGASGFIGRNIVDGLHDRVGLLIAVTASGQAVPGCHLTVAADRLSDIPSLPNDSIAINVAAVRYDPRQFAQQQSVILQRNLAIVTSVYAFCAERRISEVRQASSSAVYAAGADLLDDSVPVDLNVSPNAGELGYAWSRRFAEIAGEVHRRLCGVHTQSFRLTNPFGPHDTLDHRSAHVATSLIIRALKDPGPLRLFGNPNAQRDFVYSGDISRIFIDSCRRRGSHQTMNLASGETISIRRFAEQVLVAVGRDRPIEVSDEIAPGVNVRRATGQRLRESFPDVNLRSLAEGLRETVAWYRHALDC
jgi:nucleoside-diphosphate-sugar epimerase